MTDFNPYYKILEELNPKGEIERYQETKIYVEKLRESFKCNQTINYKDSKNRAAYMLAYYPYYIKPLSHVLTNNISVLSLEENLNIAFIGCGAAPELVGLGYFLKENGIESVKNINAYYFDRNDDYWKKSRLISQKIFNVINPVKLCTNEIFCNFFNSYEHCISQKKCDIIFPKIDIVVLQNFIGDMLGEGKNIKNELMKILDLIKPGCLIIIIDFTYSSTKILLNSIENEFSKNISTSRIVNSVKNSYTELVGFEIPKVLKETIFTREENLRPKYKTKFIYSVIKKESNQ